MHHSLQHGAPVTAGVCCLCPGLRAGSSRRWHTAQEDCAACRGGRPRSACGAREHVQLGPTSKCGRSRKGNQCWASTTSSRAAGVCRDPLGAQVLAPSCVGTQGCSPGPACLVVLGPGPAGVELLTVHGDGSRQELGTLNSGPGDSPGPCLHPDQTNLHGSW